MYVIRLHDSLVITDYDKVFDFIFFTLNFFHLLTELVLFSQRTEFKLKFFLEHTKLK